MKIEVLKLVEVKLTVSIIKQLESPSINDYLNVIQNENILGYIAYSKEKYGILKLDKYYKFRLYQCTYRKISETEFRVFYGNYYVNQTFKDEEIAKDYVNKRNKFMEESLKTQIFY